MEIKLQVSTGFNYFLAVVSKYKGRKELSRKIKERENIRNNNKNNLKPTSKLK